MTIRRFRDDERGAALVETAIVAPLCIILLAGGYEVTRGLTYYHDAQKSLRNVTRYMARLPDKALATNTLAAQLVTKSIGGQRDSSGRVVNPKTITVTIDPGLLADGVVHIDGAFAYEFPLLSILMANPSMTLNLSHQEPYIAD